MKVSVIGPGAMGCLFAGRLAKAGFTTTLIDYRADRAERLSKSGVTIESGDETIHATPRIALEVPPKQNLIIVVTKAYSTGSLILPNGVPVLTLQNGLGNVERLCDLVGSASILGGTTSGRQIQAFDSQGEWVWRYTLGSHALSTPAVAPLTDGTTTTTRVFGGSFDRYVRSIHCETGELAWAF